MIHSALYNLSFHILSRQFWLVVTQPMQTIEWTYCGRDVHLNKVMQLVGHGNILSPTTKIVPVYTVILLLGQLTTEIMRVIVCVCMYDYTHAAATSSDSKTR